MNRVDLSRILFIHPLGYGSGSALTDISRVANVMPPLGLASMAAYLERQGLKSDIIDFYAWPESESQVRDYLLEFQPGFVGFSCTTSSFLDGVRLAELVKSILPETFTVFGGVHVSALKERMLEAYSAIDFIIAGEGEETLAELMKSGGRDVSAIQGLVWREASGEVRFNGHRETSLELDSLPFPAYEKLPGYPHRYTLPIFNYPKAPNTSALSSRGCPYACSYCDRSVFRRSYRFNSAEYLYEHMKYLKERFGIRHINFYDDQFTFHLKRVDQLTGMLADKPLGMTFNCAVRAEHVTWDLLQKLKKAGCWMISLGIETGDQELLHSLDRKVNLNDLAGKVRLMHKAGIRVKGLLMMGVPGETEDSIRKTKEFIFSLPIDDFNLTKFTPFPGAPTYQTIRNHGEFDEDWARMDCMHFLFVPHGFTRQRLEALHQDFYKSHYMRPKVQWGFVAMLWKSPDSWRRFLGNLGSFIRFVRSSERFAEK